MVTVNNLAAGSRTVRVQAFSSAANTLYVCPAAMPNTELLASTVIESKV